jgi:hypothetical protein
MIDRTIEHGIPVKAEETRTGAVCVRDDNVRIVLASKGFLLFIDPKTKECKQMFFPNQNREYPFASYTDQNGYYYTGAGKEFYMVDPFIEKFVETILPVENYELAGMSICGTNDGEILFTTYPSLYLIGFHSITHQVKSYGLLDSREKYGMTLAVDDQNWAYAGIGTVRKGIVAVQLSTGEKVQLCGENNRLKGTGHVHTGKDGYVYGHLDNTEFRQENESIQWYHLLNGGMESVKFPEASLTEGKDFEAVYNPYAPHLKINKASLANGRLELMVHGKKKEIILRYESDGAQLAPFIMINDQIICGSSSHPLHFYKFLPEENEITNYGGSFFEKGGGGNICAFALQNEKLTAAAYAGGHLHIVDVDSLFSPENLSEKPKRIVSHEEIHRPRCAIAYSDGRRVLYAGFPGYGMIGGGLSVCDVGSEREEKFIPNEMLIKNQSVVSLAELKDGIVFAGCSVETHGGAKATEYEAAAFYFDMDSYKVIESFVLVKGAREITSLISDGGNHVHGVTSCSIYFLWDVNQKKIINSRDMSSAGRVIRNGMIKNENTVYLLLSDSLITIRNGGQMDIQPLIFPATAGIAWYKNKIFYASGSKLISYECSF